ncbi:MAG: energy transducer TonB [Blastocatellia bacterium]
MNHRITIFMALIFISIGAFVSIVNADSWPPPKQENYYSPNKMFYLEVTPKKLESQSNRFKDRVEGKENAGAIKGAKDTGTKGSFYVRGADGGYSKKWEYPLVSEISPVSAVVSNKGDYVVTFDNWYRVGYGNDVVVIYRFNGTLIKKFGLEDLLTERDIETLPHSVSSIWWGGKHYLDEVNGLLVLKIVSNGKSSWADDAKFHELKIELATGRPLEPKRDLFPQLHFFSIIDAGAAPERSVTAASKPICSSAEESFDSSEAVRIPSEQFYAKAKERPLPPYPQIAKAVRAQGAVVVEVLVSKTGDVICARSLSGHPLLIEAAVAAALKWKFEPIESLGNRPKAIGAIAINFKLPQ